MDIKSLFIIPLILAIVSFGVSGQNCSGVSDKKNKKTGIETSTGIVTSKDFYSLMIQKEVNYQNTAILPKYSLYLNAASRVLLTDSILKVNGTMWVKLSDSSTLNFSNVTFYNNPLGFCCTLGFQVHVTEQQMRAISNSPIVTLIVLNLSTLFNAKRQKEQQKIINCLLYITKAFFPNSNT